MRTFAKCTDQFGVGVFENSLPWFCVMCSVQQLQTKDMSLLQPGHIVVFDTAATSGLRKETRVSVSYNFGT